MRKLIQFAITMSLLCSTYAYAYIEQPYIVAKEKFFKSPNITSLVLENNILSTMDSDPNKSKVEVKGYNLKVHVGEKIPVRADFKININNNTDATQKYTVTTNITVCDVEYPLFQRVYEVKPSQQVHEGINAFPDFLSATGAGMCYIVANIELRANINGVDFVHQAIAQNTLEILA